MKLHTLPKQSESQKASRRVGRGRASGKGKTAGRGVKGQRVRNRLKLHRLQNFKQFPMLRGKREYAREWGEKPYEVTLAGCVVFDDKATVNRESLMAKGLIGDDTERPIKVLGNGSIDKPLVFSGELFFSKNAKAKIEDAGGTITEQS